MTRVWVNARWALPGKRERASLMSTSAKDGAVFDPAITFQDVWVRFDEGEVLSGVTFQVRER